VLASLTIGPISEFYCIAYSEVILNTRFQEDVLLGCAQRSTLNGLCHGNHQSLSSHFDRIASDALECNIVIQTRS
jgi:hypothetical protein